LINKSIFDVIPPFAYIALSGDSCFVPFPKDFRFFLVSLFVGVAPFYPKKEKEKKVPKL